jgi:formylglycine-generating enzyme required for sulfatase activity
MTGNVWEWTSDCYVENYEGAPGDGSARSGEAECERVTRGGSWFYPPDYLRVAFRARAGHESRDVDVGFRLAREVE